jgi:hypothetical protein
MGLYMKRAGLDGNEYCILNCFYFLYFLGPTEGVGVCEAGKVENGAGTQQTGYPSVFRSRGSGSDTKCFV